MRPGHDATNGATDADACQISPDAAGTMTYTITVQNTGDWPAYDVQILDSADLPAPSQIASLAITGNGGTTEVDTDITDGDGLEFAYPGPLAAGASLTITYTVTLTPSASNHEGDQVVNTVTVPSFYAVSGPDRAADPGRAYRTYVGGTDTDTVTIRYPKPSIAKAPVSDGSDARSASRSLLGDRQQRDSAAALKGADITDTLPTDGRTSPVPRPSSPPRGQPRRRSCSATRPSSARPDVDERRGPRSLGNITSPTR